MSAHADKTPHWKISGNINDTDTFPHIFSLETYSLGMNSCTNLCANFVYEFKCEIRTNSRIRMNVLHGKLVTNGLYCYEWPVLYK